MNPPAHRALIVEDDDKIVEVIHDHLDSLGHSHDRAATQVDARDLLAKNKYCYVLLDLEIPVKRKRIADVSHGINLLDEIKRMKENCRTQIIVMTSHGTDEPYLAVDLVKKGATSFICKPFATRGRHTPAATVKEVLGKACKHDPADCPFLAGGPPPEPHPAHAESNVLKPFVGGTLVFHDRHVELLGDTVITARAKVSFGVLRALAEKKPNGSYVAYSGNDLLQKLGLELERGQNDAAGYVRYIRNQCERLLRKHGFSCGRQDVIQSGGRGYRLNSHIEIEDGDGC